MSERCEAFHFADSTCSEIVDRARAGTVAHISPRLLWTAVSRSIARCWHNRVISRAYSDSLLTDWRLVEQYEAPINLKNAILEKSTPHRSERPQRKTNGE